MKKTRYEGRQRREKQRGRDLSEETALAGAQRQREQKKKKRGGEGRRQEKGGERRSELTRCLPTAARSWIRRPCRLNEGKKGVEHVLFSGMTLMTLWPGIPKTNLTGFTRSQKDVGGTEVVNSNDWRSSGSKLLAGS